MRVSVLVLATFGYANFAAPALADQKLLIELTEGSDILGRSARSNAGARVVGSPLGPEDSPDAQPVVAETDGDGRAILDFANPGAYSILIKIETDDGPVYWSGLRALVDDETPLMPEGALSADDFSPILDFSSVTCEAGLYGATAHPVREILTGRIGVLEAELAMHDGRADGALRGPLKQAAPPFYDQLVRALATSSSAREKFDAVDELRKSKLIPGTVEQSTGRYAEENVEGTSGQFFGPSLDAVWLSLLLAAEVEKDLDILRANLAQCSAPASTLQSSTPKTGRGQFTALPQTTARSARSRAARPTQTSDPVSMPGRKARWHGFYAGVHAGAAFTDADFRAGVGAARIPVSVNGDGFAGGLLLGYNHRFDRFVLGVEADVTLGNVSGSNTLAGVTDPRFEAEVMSTLRARAGYTWDDVMVFAHVGLGIVTGEVTESIQLGATAKRNSTHIGLVAGAGVEWSLTEALYLRGEYLYGNFDRRSYSFGAVSDSLDFEMHVIRAAITLEFGS